MEENSISFPEKRTQCIGSLYANLIQFLKTNQANRSCQVTFYAALEVAGVGEGDEVIVPALTMSSTNMCFRVVGGNHAAFPGCHVLTSLKTEWRHVCRGTYNSPFVISKETLCIIFNYRYIMLIRNFNIWRMDARLSWAYVQNTEFHGERKDDCPIR